MLPYAVARSAMHEVPSGFDEGVQGGIRQSPTPSGVTEKAG
jgi:hypothetical protein